MSNNPLEQIYSDGLCDIEFITQNCLFEGGYDANDYDKIMHFIIKGLKDINIFHVVNKKSVKLLVNSINCIDLPRDYVDYLKIGITYSNGLFWTFTQNQAISFQKDFNCGIEHTTNIQAADNTGVNSKIVQDNFKKVNTYYGYTGGNNNQYFRVEKEFNRIHLKADAIGSYVEIEYITTGINTSNDTIVPVMYNDTLVAFALWQIKLRTPKTSANDIEMARIEWVRNFSKLNRALSASTKNEWLDMIYSHYKRTVKNSA